MSFEREFTYADIKVERKGTLLRIENAALLREFDISQAVPKTVKYMDKNSGRVLAEGGTYCDFSFVGYNMPDYPSKTVDYILKDIDAVFCPASVFEGEHVKVSIKIYETIQRLSFERVYHIYPGLPYMAAYTFISSETIPSVYWNRRDQLNRDADPIYMESRAETLKLVSGLKASKIVWYQGRTDYTNDVYREGAPEGELLNGNILICRDGDVGLFFLQEAPPSEERRDFERHDFRLDGDSVYSCCWGIPPDEIKPDCNLRSYRHVTGFFKGDESAASLSIKKYLKTRFPLDPATHCTVMVNPWGCGNFPALVSESFLIEEFKASGKLGATHYQIDDGWQKGRALREFEANHRHPGDDFWTINKELLPFGFGPVCKAAAEAGVEPALWFAPAAHLAYREWKKDAATLLRFHLENGFRFFKLDFIRARSKESEDNLEKMMRYLREVSNGEIYFNLDTTNGQRPGYFLFLEYGNIFLENRYLCREWGQVYHPEHVLNNLWRLAKYCRTQTIQIEFSDPDIINYSYFEKKGINPPDEYSSDYWVAVAMFASPLLWFAPSRLKEKTAEAFSRVIKLHRKYASEIFAGEVLPIGEEPSGKAVTGLVSHNADKDSGLIIVYREKKAAESADIKLSFLKGDYKLTELSPEGEAKSEFGVKNGVLSVKLEKAASWKLFRYTK